MLKIWKGPEMEGNDIGIMTLFVCSDEEVDTKTLIQCVSENPDIRRIYFGAGRLPFLGVSDWKALYDYLWRYSINIIIEVDNFLLKDFIDMYDSLLTTFIVVHYNMPFTYNNLQFKTDDAKAVKIFTVSSRTMLDTLKDNNLFMCDTMLKEGD